MCNTNDTTVRAPVDDGDVREPEFADGYSRLVDEAELFRLPRQLEVVPALAHNIKVKVKNI